MRIIGNDLSGRPILHFEDQEATPLSKKNKIDSLPGRTDAGLVPAGEIPVWSCCFSEEPENLPLVIRSLFKDI